MAPALSVFPASSHLSGCQRGWEPRSKQGEAMRRKCADTEHNKDSEAGGGGGRVRAAAAFMKEDVGR